ncbi:hypothetical protein BZG36_04847 [Bifiguratus adelaidae]|uniref:ER-bound oxygenase mpaB/mpaB'/Rubber oxygenase catalytic domain-containing protein n=1 Tax=Bifiguratus adelaidae TaxID=1938954 RepID=A0A261XW02_9FUNG|nr:hypothetical protein BZG36_04847 [Bifiguratus adelaidae]
MEYLRYLDYSRLPNDRSVVIGCVAAFVVFNQLLRYRRYRLINHAPIVTDKQLDMNAVHTLFLHSFAGFPWSMGKSLGFALFRTYGIPTISRLLVKTAEFGASAVKRGDDTGLIIDTFLENAPNSEESLRAIKRMNYIHDQYRGKISNDDFLYTLSVFVFCPIRWMRKYEWRAMSPREEELHFLIWRDIGEKMGIDKIPNDTRIREMGREVRRGAHDIC